jgi:tripartite-type tricarboxylate transporter receptor subunit TctC
MMVAPAATPRPIVDRLNAELSAVLAQADTKEQILKYGFLPLQNRDVEALKDFVRSETARWGKVVEDAGIAKSQ